MPLPVRLGWRTVLSGFLALGVFSGITFAEDKKDPKPPEPPNPVVTIPLGLFAGNTNLLTLRGQRLKDATNVVLAGLSEPVTVLIKKREDSKVPDGQTVERAGDQLLELEVVVPLEAAGRTNLAWLVSSPAGTGRSLATLAFRASALGEAKKPNSSFREAPKLLPGQRIRGALSEPGDVAVFQWDGAAGETLRAEVIASRLNSTLDAILTLYDSKGTILASNDDAYGRDPALTNVLAAAGPVFVAVTYANEKAAKTHGYLLNVEVSK